MRLRSPGVGRCRPRLPRRTARLRLTVLYSMLFLACGTVLLAVTYLLADQAILGGGQRFGVERHRGGTPRTALGAAQLHGLSVVAGQVREAARQQRAWDLEQLMIYSGIALAIGAVVAVVAGWLVAGRVLRPLATITATARRISASNLSERLAIYGPDDELKALGDTLDDLFARLEASFGAQRHFIANASHELRSPLTEERTLLQVALDDPGTTAEVWRSTSREVLASNAGQERLIEALLTLAASEAGLEHREPADLAAAAGGALRACRSGITRLGLRVGADTGPAALDGDPVLLGRLAANLIDNAVRHNIPGGHIEVATGTEGGRAVLSVASTGPVIPPADVGRLFQPFQRLSTRRTHNGHGLGLSIVRAIATAHGAAITARALPQGGLAISVTFPPAATPHPAAGGPASTAAGRS